MLTELDLPLSAMEAASAEAASLMRTLGNPQRLLILCHLAGAGELPVGDLVERIGISQSALSQHLAKLRAEGLVTFRREGQSLFYRVNDPRAVRVLELLHTIYCPDLGKTP